MKFNKIVASVVIGFLISLLSVSAFAGWERYEHHHWSHHASISDHHDENNLAAGLFVGGLAGVLAGSALVNSQPRYVYDAPVTMCHQERRPLWSRRFCDYAGCYVKTKWAWRTVCRD